MKASSSQKTLMQDLHEQESLAMLKLAQDFPGLSFDHPQSEDPKKLPLFGTGISKFEQDNNHIISEEANEEDDDDLKDIMETLRKSLNQALSGRQMSQEHIQRREVPIRNNHSPLMGSGGPQSRGYYMNADGGGTGGGDHHYSRNNLPQVKHQSVIDTNQRDRSRIESMIQSRNQNPVVRTIDPSQFPYQSQQTMSKRILLQQKGRNTYIRHASSIMIDDNNSELITSRSKQPSNPKSSRSAVRAVGRNISVNNYTMQKIRYEAFRSVSTIKDAAVSDASVERMLKFNGQMKNQIYGIIESLEGKIRRAKERKVQTLVKDPNIYAFKEKSDQLKNLTSQRNTLKVEIEQCNRFLEERYNITKVVELENDLKDKLHNLAEIRKQYDFTKHEDAQKQEHYNKIISDNKLYTASQNNNDSEFKSLQNQLRRHKAIQNKLQRRITDQQGQIIQKEKDCENLVKVIKTVKEAQDQGKDVPSNQKKQEIQQMEMSVLNGHKELFQLSQAKKDKEAKFIKEKVLIEKKTQASIIEVKMLELRLKDRDHALRTAYIRQKELVSMIDDFKKLQKTERLKSKRVQQQIAVIHKVQRVEQITPKRERKAVLPKQMPQQQTYQYIPHYTVAVSNQQQHEEESNFFGLTQVEETAYEYRQHHTQQQNSAYFIEQQPSDEEQQYQIIVQVPIEEQEDRNNIIEMENQMEIMRSESKQQNHIHYQEKASPLTRYGSQEELPQ